MKKLLLILFTLLCLTTQGKPPPRDVYTTVSSGDWSTVGVWDLGSSPANNQTDGSDDIIITHHITLTDDLTVKSGTTILIEGCDTLHVTGNVTFNNGSAITVEPCAVLIIDGNVTNNNNSTNVIINGTVIIGGNYSGGTGSELSGTGEMEIDGSVSTSGGATVFGSSEDCTVDCDNSSSDPLGNDPLPIALMWFTGAFEDDNIVIRWATASEINNSHFLVERLVGSDWEPVTTQTGLGTTTVVTMYEHIDYRAQYGYNYYRLSQFDFDGTQETFKIIAVMKPYDLTIKDMTIYPNPTTSENVNIELTGFRGDEVLLIVMNTLEQIFFEKAVVAENDNIIIVLNSKLSPGTYLVIGSNKQELYKKKLIIK